MYGYLMEITRGARVVPELDDYGRLFFDGVKLIVVGLIYAIPLFIVYALILGATVALMGSGSDTGAVAGIGTMMIGFLVILILGVMIALFEVIGSIRLARTDSIGEVFNFSAILAHIGRIGWGSYIVALIVLYLVLFVFFIAMAILGVLTFGLGFLLFFALAPAFSIFVARYVTRIYDSAPAPA